MGNRKLKQDMRAVDLLVGEDGERYVYSDQVGHLIRKAHQQASAIFQQHSVEPQLTSVQFSMLFAVATYGALSQSQLGKLAAIDVSTLTGVVDRLRERGLLDSSAEAGDRRKNIIGLTDKGREVVRRMASVGHRVSEATLAPLTPVERVALVALLKKLTASPPSA
mgnify:CR=1 FL=1